MASLAWVFWDSWPYSVSSEMEGSGCWDFTEKGPEKSAKGLPQQASGYRQPRPGASTAWRTRQDEPQEPNCLSGKAGSFEESLLTVPSAPQPHPGLPWLASRRMRTDISDRPAKRDLTGSLEKRLIPNARRTWNTYWAWR